MIRGRVGIALWLLALALGAGSVRPAAADDAGKSPAETIQAAKAKAIAFLRSRQGEDGSWGATGGDATYGRPTPEKGAASKAYTYPLGATALSLYALLASGVPKEDPAVARGFAALDKISKSGVLDLSGPSAYEASAMLLAFTARAKGPLAWRRGDSVRIETEERRRAQSLVETLLRMRSNFRTSGWRYSRVFMPPAPGGEEDVSSTGFAALALFAADRCGLKIPEELWPELVAFVEKQQEREGPEHDRAVDEASLDLSGKAAPAPAEPTKPREEAAAPKDHARGFSYIRNETLAPDERLPTGGVTACGIATIQVARLVLGRRTRKGWGARAQAEAHRSLLDGCAWLDANWSASSNPHKKRIDVYHLLHLAHVGDAMDLVGSTHVGSHDWYAEMSQALLGMQKEDGSWESGSTHAPAAVLDTCFALLFFARPFGAPSPPPAGK